MYLIMPESVTKLSAVSLMLELVLYAISNWVNVIAWFRYEYIVLFPGVYCQHFIYGDL